MDFENFRCVGDLWLPAKELVLAMPILASRANSGRGAGMFGRVAPVISGAGLGSATVGNGVSSIAKATTALAPKGSMIVVGIMFGGSPTISSISDGVNTYTLAKNQGTNCHLYSSNILTADLASSTTITCTLSGTTTNEGWIALGYITGLSSNSVDGSATSTAASGSLSCGPTSALAQANEAAVICHYGYAGGSTAAVTETSGFTQFTQTQGFGTDVITAVLAWKKLTSASALTWTATVSPAYSQFHAALATFKGY